MNSFLPPVLEKVGRKLRGVALWPQLRRYLASMSNNNPLRGLPVGIVGDAYADPTEYFTHYSAFAYWVANKLSESGDRHQILDVGSPKTQNAMLSASHDVTSVVLTNCSDPFSAVMYVEHDISDPLPFADASFDRLTSTVALPLVGLGRYGDRVNSNCLPDFVRELGRVMKKDAELYVSMCLGPNFLAYNNGWYLDIKTIQRVFGEDEWHMIEATVDNALSPKQLGKRPLSQRFTSLDQAVEIKRGDFRVVFCQFRRQNSGDYAHGSSAEMPL